MLNRPDVVTVVGKFVAARMAEHMRMRWEGQAGEPSCGTLLGGGFLNRATLTCASTRRRQPKPSINDS